MCLEDELFGPDRMLTPAEVQGRVADLRGAELAEAEDLLKRPRTKRNRRFRAQLERIADLRETAVATTIQERSVFHDLILQGVGVRGMPYWQLLRDQERVMRNERAKLGAVDAPTARQSRAEQVAWYERTLTQLAPVWQLVKVVDDFLQRGFPALATLPWTANWVLRLARNRLSGTHYVESGSRIWGAFGGGMVPTLTFTQPDLGVPAVEVDWSDSRESVRQRLIAALERLFYQCYAAEQGAPALDTPPSAALFQHRRFRQWLKRNLIWGQVTAALEEFLDQSHAPGKRPFALDPLRQVRRDVHLWARVKIDGHPALVLAEDHTNRFKREEDFRARSGGKRPRLPTSEKGVLDAVARADRLLRTREI